MRDGELDPTRHLVHGTTTAIGYHTRFGPGIAVHPIRESLNWARRHLAGEDPALQAEARLVLATVLALQDTDPCSPTYGIWSWFAEEPLARMAPPDWNWADFNGAALAEILARHGDRLDPGLRERARAALGHAAWSIFRRNVRPDYTNIAIMGAAVALCAGELLAEPRLLDYGRARLAAFSAHTARHGGFNEYNSPTYTVVALEELERIHRLVRDDAARRLADDLLRTAWSIIASHFHPGTGQWAGPNSRAYHDRLASAAAALLARKTGAAIAPHPRAAPGAIPDWALEGPPCPPDLAARFAALPAPAVEEASSLLLRDDGSRKTGTTWMDADACLGSASDESFWTQTRPILGYWRTSADPAVVLRVRLLKDGRDFASGQVRCVQRGPRLLAAVGLLTGSGDWHPSLDRPADGAFAASDLRLRIALAGTGVAAAALGAGRWALAAGGHRAVVHAAPDGCGIGGGALRWESGGDADAAWIDAVIPCPPRFAPARDPWPRLAFALELLPVVTEPATESPVLGDQTARWNGLEVALPR